MPPNFVLKSMNTAHRVLLAVSGGRIGKQFGTMPVVELTTTGKKSGLPRTVLLTSPVQDGANVLVVASRGGDPTHPAWYTNLVANPEVTFNAPGEAPRKAVATTVPAQERAELWSKVVKAYKGYAGYQERTSREIPLVWLSPKPN